MAEVYDDLFALGPDDAGPAAARLADLASGGRVLELGIGTGRIALPLAALGVEVWGIDASRKMVDRLRAKPDGAKLPVVIGDFADVDVRGEYRLVYVAFNTFYLFRSQEDQVRCIENVAAHLELGGAFVVEAMIPNPTIYRFGQMIHLYEAEPGHLWFEAGRYDSRTQQARGQHVILTESGAKFYPTAMRFAPPSELDLMTRLAGLSLETRQGGWDGEPFTALPGSSHVSVYRKPALS